MRSGGPLLQLSLDQGNHVGVADLKLTNIGVGLLLGETFKVVKQDGGGEGGDAVGGEELHGVVDLDELKIHGSGRGVNKTSQLAN